MKLVWGKPWSLIGVPNEMGWRVGPQRREEIPEHCEADAGSVWHIASSLVWNSNTETLPSRAGLKWIS